MDYKPAHLDLTNPQAKKLLSGASVRLTRNQIGKGDNIVYLHPAQHRMLTRAAAASKGYVLELTPGEILTTVEHDLTGNGLFSNIWKNLKSGYNWVKKNVVDTDFYQKEIKPVVRKLVDQGANMAKVAYPGASNLFDSTVNTLSQKTGAFGVKKAPRSRISRKANALMPGGSFRLN